MKGIVLLFYIVIIMVAVNRPTENRDSFDLNIAIINQVLTMRGNHRLRLHFFLSKKGVF